MAQTAKEEPQLSELSVTVDAGHFNDAQFQECEDAAITNKQTAKQITITETAVAFFWKRSSGW
jgi:hypothetical protein